MDDLILALICFLAGGLGSLLLSRSPLLATLSGAGGSIVGGVLGLRPALAVLGGGPTFALRLPWNVPAASFSLEVDPLSAFFLVIIFGISALAALYGAEYLWSYRARRSLGAPWFFYNLLVGSMALVVTARNGVLFLLAWEAMTLASFFLVCFEDEREQVRSAGWTYLIASHLGTAFLFALFIVLGNGADTLDFDRFATGAPNVAFLLALIGFGTKAGFLPLHVWLPEAHPAAPSHVSALMSAVLIKMGVYGLLRVLTILGTPPEWWGWLMVGVGAASGVVGILLALGQNDLKRLLAYSSVENIGLIGVGIGMGLLGQSSGAPGLALLGYSGALLHVWNHSLFKSALFLGSGVVLHGAGTRQIDRLGGLLKRMPVTGACFLIAVLAITATPPLNGFASEFLLYSAVLKGGPHPLLFALLPILALIGGLAVACFVKAFGVSFLGEPRSPEAASAHEPGWAMRLPLVLLAGACLLAGLMAPRLLPILGRIMPAFTDPEALSDSVAVLTQISFVGKVLLLAIVLFAVARKALLWRKPVDEGVTWDCGYAAPTARMQYSGSSFVQPLTDLFGGLAPVRRELAPPKGLFPSRASLSVQTPDLLYDGFYSPLFRLVDRALARLRWLQARRVQAYVLYVALTLLVLLVWKLG